MASRDLFGAAPYPPVRRSLKSRRTARPVRKSDVRPDIGVGERQRLIARCGRHVSSGVRSAHSGGGFSRIEVVYRIRRNARKLRSVAIERFQATKRPAVAALTRLRLGRIAQFAIWRAMLGLSGGYLRAAARSSLQCTHVRRFWLRSMSGHQPVTSASGTSIDPKQAH